MANPTIQERFFRAAIIRSMEKDPAQIDRAVNAMWLRSENGDVAAYSAIRDTLDGKPTQEISGPNGGPITLQFTTLYEPLLAGSGPTIEHEQIAPQSPTEGPQGPENGG